LLCLEYRKKQTRCSKNWKTEKEKLKLYIKTTDAVDGKNIARTHYPHGGQKKRANAIIGGHPGTLLYNQVSLAKGLKDNRQPPGITPGGYLKGTP
jgi:hypothetical protein